MSTALIYVESPAKFKPEMLADIMRAHATIAPGGPAVTVTRVRTGKGKWRDSSAPMAQLTVEYQGSATLTVFTYARLLAEALDQVCVLVVHEVPYGTGHYERTERVDPDQDHTVLDGMGQRPYAYVPKYRGDYAVQAIYSR